MVRAAYSLLNHIKPAPRPEQPLPLSGKDKKRVVAIDYLRGLCMASVVVDHFRVFSSPLIYVTGRGQLWVSTAEMFFLLSGITLGIVRGRRIITEFGRMAQLMWRRALKLYLADIAVVAVSLGMSYGLLAAHVAIQVPGTLPNGQLVAHVIASILLLSYTFGWASFVMYYAIYLLVAPFALRTLKTGYHWVVPLLSILVFLLSAWHPVAASPYRYFFIWQVYFFLGLVVAEHREPILRWAYRLPQWRRQLIAWLIAGAAALVVLLSNFLTFKTRWLAAKITSVHAIPALIRTPISWLAGHQPSFNYWLQQNRSGLLRPAAALIVMAGLYVVYQRYKQILLPATGWFFNPIGQSSLYVFIVQALLIPPLSGLPLPHHNVLINSLLIILLEAVIWIMVRSRFLFWLIPR